MVNKKSISATANHATNGKRNAHNTPMKLILNAANAPCSLPNSNAFEVPTA